MSLPIFSQTDTTTDLICLPTGQAKKVVKDLRNYDFCQQERDSLKAEIKDLNFIIGQNSILIDNYKNATDTLLLVNENYVNQKIILETEVKTQNKKIKSLKSTRNLTILTTLVGTLTPILLSKN